MSERSAQSFNDEEIEILDFVMKTLLRGGSVGTVITRREAFRSLATKVVRMRQKIDERKTKRQAAE